jgi:CcmD family protein
MMLTLTTLTMTTPINTMTKIIRLTLASLTLIAGLWAAPDPAWAQQTPATAARPAQPQAATDQFVPMDEIPEQDKLPAAPYLIAAYMIAWLLLLFYVWSLWRRLQRVEEELKRIAPGSSVSEP